MCNSIGLYRFLCSGMCNVNDRKRKCNRRKTKEKTRRYVEEMKPMYVFF